MVMDHGMGLTGEALENNLGALQSIAMALTEARQLLISLIKTRPVVSNIHISKVPNPEKCKIWIIMFQKHQKILETVY